MIQDFDGVSPGALEPYVSSGLIALRCPRVNIFHEHIYSASIHVSLFIPSRGPSANVWYETLSPRKKVDGDGPADLRVCLSIPQVIFICEGERRIFFPSSLCPSGHNFLKWVRLFFPSSFFLSLSHNTVTPSPQPPSSLVLSLSAFPICFCSILISRTHCSIYNPTYIKDHRCHSTGLSCDPCDSLQSLDSETLTPPMPRHTYLLGGSLSSRLPLVIGSLAATMAQGQSSRAS